jgi:2-polyprenyl-3-methyl-5-hydroxy-6-metoxy-1,4-benzoquinol methylase
MKLSEKLLYGLVRWTKRRTGSTSLVNCSSFEEYFEWQYSTTRALLETMPNLDLAGATVLEIGCGTGGRTAYLASCGASRVVGIDINAHEIGLARQFCEKFHPELVAKVEYLASKEDEMLPLGSFDYVILIDSFEHVVHPPQILRLCYEYTRPGGRCYFTTLGWYHHGGSHMRLIPWVQCFFSDETILNVTRRILSSADYKPSRFDSDPPARRWEGICNLRDRPGEHLNKITIREIRKTVGYSPFAESHVHVTPYQARRLRPFRFLSAVPFAQEMFHSTVVGELVRASLTSNAPEHVSASRATTRAGPALTDSVR